MMQNREIENVLVRYKIFWYYLRGKLRACMIYDREKDYTIWVGVSNAFVAFFIFSLKIAYPKKLLVLIQ